MSLIPTFAPLSRSEFPHMDISMIVAASANNVIGRGGKLPWKLPEDLKRFKAVTMGKPIIMGRLTYESIGRPLPGRKNIVLSSRAGYAPQGCYVAKTVDEALSAAADAEEVMVIGGGHVYAAFLPRASRIYLTRVHANIDGDAFFPQLDEAEWELVSSEEFPAMNECGFSIQLLQRR